MGDKKLCKKKSLYKLAKNNRLMTAGQLKRTGQQKKPVTAGQLIAALGRLDS
jgi:hypothetical protein